MGLMAWLDVFVRHTTSTSVLVGESQGHKIFRLSPSWQDADTPLETALTQP